MKKFFKWLLGVAKGAMHRELLEGGQKMDELEPKIEQLIIEKGPAAAKHVVDMVQIKLVEQIDKVFGGPLPPAQ